MREAADGIVLVVVVRHERRRPGVPDGLVVAVDVAEVAPAVLVDDLALVLEGVVALDRRVDEAEVAAVDGQGRRRQVGDGAGFGIPLGGRVRERAAGGTTPAAPR